MSFVDSNLQDKKVRALCTMGAQTEKTIGIVIQKIVKVFSALCRVGKHRPFSKVIAPHIIFNREIVRFGVLSPCVNGFAPIEQRKFLADVTTPRPGPDGVDLKLCARKSGHDTAFRYISYELFNTLHESIGNNALYKLGSKWSALDNFDIPVNDKSHPMVFKA